jgi:hypothetical protein
MASPAVSFSDASSDNLSYHDLRSVFSILHLLVATAATRWMASPTVQFSASSSDNLSYHDLRSVFSILHLLVATAATRWMASPTVQFSASSSGAAGYNTRCFACCLQVAFTGSKDFLSCLTCRRYVPSAMARWRKATPWSPVLDLRFNFAGFEGNRCSRIFNKSAFQGKQDHSIPCLGSSMACR